MEELSLNSKISGNINSVTVTPFSINDILNKKCENLQEGVLDMSKNATHSQKSKFY